MYGVVHGGMHEDLRVRSAKFADANFESLTIGGIYGTKKDLYQIVEWVLSNVTEEKVRHLFTARELLYYKLATYHNVYFIVNLMKKIRESIKEGNFKDLKKEYMGI